MTTETATIPHAIPSGAKKALQYVIVGFALYLLIAAVQMLSSALAFTVIPDSLMTSLESPLFAIAAGTILTILLQSSTASTAVIIALTASSAIDLSTAVFLVMGANIGTTVTNSAVALGYIRDKKMFATTFSAGTVHDFFNLFAVILLGCLEHFTSFLSTSASWLAGRLYGSNAENPVSTIFLNISDGVSGVFKAPAQLLVSWNVHSIIMFILSLAMILGAIAILTKTLQTLQNSSDTSNDPSDILYSPPLTALGQLKAILAGAITTAIVQSSSVTTSAAVVGVGTKRYTVQDIYPFIAGANIGTTLTALLVALMTGSDAALAVALTHVLFNVVAVLIFCGIPYVKNLPIYMSLLVDKYVQRSRLFAALYMGIFIVLPIIIILIYS